MESQRRYFEEKIEHIEKEALGQVSYTVKRLWRRVNCETLSMWYLKQIETVEAQSKAALEECKKLEQTLTLANKEKQALEKKSNQVVYL